MAAIAPNSRSFYAITALAELASGVLFIAMVSGTSLTPVLGYFVQLPLFFVGLSLGLTSAIYASIGSSLIVWVSTSLAAAAIFAMVQIVPVLVVVRFALLSRQGAHGAEWYPPGLLIGQLTVAVLATALLALGITALWNGPLLPLFEQSLGELETALVSRGAPIGITSGIEPVIPYIPGVIAASWFVMIVLNGVLAQWLAGRQGQALRPAPQLRTIALPNWSLPAFAICTALAYLISGEIRVFAGTAAIVLGLPFFFQGLAVMHALARKLAMPKVALFGFYIALVLFSWPLVLVLVGLGVVETWAKIRGRVAA